MTEWDTLTFPDTAAAARASLPAAIVAPAGATEGIGEFTRSMAAGWAKQFREELPDDPRAEGLRVLVEKEPIWLELEPLLLAEDWPQVLAVSERILEVDPDDAAARFNQASARRNLGDAEGALASFDAVRETFETEGVYHANRARTLADLGRRDEAVAAYRRTLELLPGDTFALAQLADLGELVVAASPEGEPLYVERADFEEAVRQDLAQNDGDAGYLANAANALLGQGHADMARTAAQLALVAQPGREEAHLALGTAYARLGRHDEALAELDGHVQRVPTSAVGHASRAHALYAAGRKDEAREAADRALVLDPSSVTAAQVAVAGDDGPRAALARAIALAGNHPRSWAAWRVAGDLALAQDDTVAAVEHFERAIDGGADDANIGMMLGELGQRGLIDDVCRLADVVPRLVSRDPGLRWNAATAYERAGRGSEGRILFASIAHDARVPADLRDAARGRAAELEG